MIQANFGRFVRFPRGLWTNLPMTKNVYRAAPSGAAFLLGVGMAKGKNEMQELAEMVFAELKGDAEHLSAQLLGKTPPDTKHQTRAQYLERLRQKWDDSQFRLDELDRMGEEAFLAAAAEAFGTKLPDHDGLEHWMYELGALEGQGMVQSDSPTPEPEPMAMPPEMPQLVAPAMGDAMADGMAMQPQPQPMQPEVGMAPPTAPMEGGF